ncbi:hypothetical protein QVD17_28678 [Tagetes erecta]|uniref:Uncharacterized protein n=1 Tax=Tagetes erecta TaxID=13708 RepID=A0AAD8NSY4_TARER|nr:hypothetical protein QVD17_28678 [Tagetes erecta]
MVIHGNTRWGCWDSVEPPAKKHVSDSVAVVRILGNMKNDPSSLMLLTLMKNLHGSGYMLQSSSVLYGI